MSSNVTEFTETVKSIYTFFIIGDKAEEFVQFQGFKLFSSNGTTFPDIPYFTHDPAIQPGSKIPINVSNQLVQTIKIVLDNQIMSICEVKVYEGGKYLVGCK